MATKSKDPLAKLKSDGPADVYFIDGEERVLVDEAIKTIKQAALPKTAADFNFESLSGRDVAMVRVLDAANTLPAFAARRLVIVHQAEKLVGGTKAKVKAQDVEPLLAYLESPSPTTTLVFVGDRFDGRAKVYTRAKKKAVVIRYDRPKPREMPMRVRERAKALGLEVREDALRAVVDAVGTDVSEASRTLELAALYVGPNESRAITADDIAAVATITREENIFALVDQLGAGDRAQVMRGLFQMVQVSREPALRILAMLARQLRMLVRAKIRGGPEGRLARELGVPPFVAGKLLRQVRGYQLDDLTRSLYEVGQADRALKGGALPDLRALERLAFSSMPQR